MRKNTKITLALLLSLLMVLLIAPIPAFAAEASPTVTLSSKAAATASGTSIILDYNATDGLTYQVGTAAAKAYTGSITFHGSGESGDCILVKAGTHKITLDAVNITVKSTVPAAAFSVYNGAAADVTLANTASLTGGSGAAGMRVRPGGTLNLNCGSQHSLYCDSYPNACGELAARGMDGGAGIGGNIGEACGKITVNGGIIKAYGSAKNSSSGGGAGIGGGGSDAGGDAGGVGTTSTNGLIKIACGSVSAYGAAGGAGIGGGGATGGKAGGNAGKIVLTGGNVFALGTGSGAGIGGGGATTPANSGDSGVITIDGGTIKAIKGKDGAQDIGAGSGGTFTPPVNSSGKEVYLTTIRLVKRNTYTSTQSPYIDTPIQELTGSSGTVSYNMLGAKTDVGLDINDSSIPSTAKGYLLLYLPNATEVKGVKLRTGDALTGSVTTKTDGTASEIFSINMTATPEFSPAAGTYSGTQTVTLTCATPGAIIYYTTGNILNASCPSVASGGTVSVTESCTLSAFAKASGYSSSYLKTAAYTITSGGSSTLGTVSVDYPAGEYEGSVSVALTSSNSGTIYYTLDGTTPTASSASVTSGGTVTIDKNCTLKACTINSSGTLGTVFTAAYQIRVHQPKASPAGGNGFSTSTMVTLTCATSNATVYYTTDGTDPASSSTRVQYILGNQISVALEGTLKAIAVKSGLNNSYVMTEKYSASSAAVDTPTATPAAGTYDGVQYVTLYCSTGSASIYYTLDGNTPTSSSAKVSSGSRVTIDKTCTLKAIAMANNYNSSAMLTASYYIKVTKPVASPAGGTNYTSAQTVTLTCATTGASIYYTTDGSTPSSYSSLYSSAITVPLGTTLKAIGYKNGLTNSDVMTETYTGGGSSATKYSIYNTARNIWVSNAPQSSLTLVTNPLNVGSTQYDALNQYASGKTIRGCWDIYFSPSITMTEPTALNFLLTANDVGKQFTVLHSRKDGALEVLYATVQSDCVATVYTNSFSPFMLLEGYVSTSDLVKSEKHGDTSLFWWEYVLLFMGLLLPAGAIAVLSYRGTKEEG